MVWSMDAVFFVYGLAFYALGFSILVQPRRHSRFQLARCIHWLAVFGLLHGTLEFSDMWQVIRGGSPWPEAWGNWPRGLLLLLSFIPLFEFGRRLLLAAWTAPPAWLDWRLHGLPLGLLLLVLWGPLPGDRALALGARYSYGFCGALLTGLAFLAYCRLRLRGILSGREGRWVNLACHTVGLAFIAYALLAGVVVQAEAMFPARLLNQELFLGAFGVPVQVFRALVAVLVALTATYLLRIFELEGAQRLEQAVAVAEQALQETRRLAHHNELLLDSAGEGVFGVDGEGRISFINPLALELFAGSEVDFLGQSAHRLTHHHRADGALYEKETCPTWLTLQDGQVRRVEGEVFWRRDGQAFPVTYVMAPLWEQGRIVGAVVMFQDVSERERSAQALRDSEAMHRLIIETAAEGFWMLGPDRRTLEVNQTLCAMLGYNRDEFIGRSPLEFVDADNGARLQQQLAEVGLKAHRYFELELRHRDGTPIPAFFQATTHFDAGGAVRRSFALVTDLREQKAAERQLREAEAELRRHRDHLEEMLAERTASLTHLNRELIQARDAAEAASRAKSTFLANMSHELRTPMNAVIGFTHVLRRTLQLPEQTDKLDKITQAAQHLLGVLNDILDFSKIEAGRMRLEQRPFHLGELLASVRAVMGGRIQEKGLQLREDLPPALPLALIGDPTRLSQALINYLGNACKFTEHGEILLRVVQEEASTERVRLRFEVVDSGRGLSKDQLSRLFQAFEQADNSATRHFGGTGLGLVITRELARLMGGDAGASSPGEGLGACFWFTAELLRQPEAPPQTVATTVAASEEYGPQAVLRHHFAECRLLLVEDEPMNREVALELLQDGPDLQVDVARDGAEALRMAVETRYALILMDMQMPVMDGLTATRALRQLPGYARTPIVAMTANAFSEDRQRCLDAGMNDHIGKPVVPDELYRMLIKWLSLAD